MTWQEGFGLLRLLTEEQVGHPAREAQAIEEQQRISAMREGLDTFGSR